MATRTVSAEEHQWELVASAVHARRTALGMTANDLVKRAGKGLSPTVLSHIENGKQPSYAIRTISSLERALDWMPGSVQAILAGGEAEEQWMPPPPGPNPPVTVQKPPRGERILPPEWEERFRALEREVARLKDELDQERADRLAEKEDRERQLAEAIAVREQRAEANQRRRQQRETETTT